MDTFFKTIRFLTVVVILTVISLFAILPQADAGEPIFIAGGPDSDYKASLSTNAATDTISGPCWLLSYSYTAESATSSIKIIDAASATVASSKTPEFQRTYTGAAAGLVELKYPILIKNTMYIQQVGHAVTVFTVPVASFRRLDY